MPTLVTKTSAEIQYVPDSLKSWNYLMTLLGSGRDGIELIGEVIPEETLTYNKKESVVDPLGTVYFTANSASCSKFYPYSYTEEYTNIYLAAWDASQTASYLNVEVKGSTLTVSAWSVEKFDADGEIDENGEPKLIDTYSIHKDID